MAEKDQDKRDKALDLTEAALDALDSGDEKKADKLIDEAKKLDPSAVEEVVHDLEEAEHTSMAAEADDDLGEDVEEKDEEAAG
ncbi:MAG: hypothetical protein JOY90_14570 [Bradyrhizobium sp.]|uniref:hypothetical protein n=1 Tax=Bradyrhizobium sp. TaxID=376 RepID=UPI001D61AD95|nr:hypothetical protein [Bradyrhizobium sp.]MBV9561653.1 hypothetical protein [Bradyrhizobium sp.]